MGQAAHVLAHNVGHHGFEHADLDRLALARLQPVSDRRQHRRGGRLTNDAVDDRQRHTTGYPITDIGDQTRDGASRLDHVIVSSLDGIRPVLTATNQ